MLHGISEEEWEAYVEGALCPSEQDRIEAHMISCISCWERYDDLKHTTDELRKEGADIRRAVALSDEREQAAFIAVLRRLQLNARIERREILDRIEQLEQILARMCGTRTAVQALQSAAKESPAQELNSLGPETWEPFIENLASIAEVMCGESGALLLRRSVQFQ